MMGAGNFWPCPRCEFEATTRAELDEHLKTCPRWPDPPAAKTRRDTGGDLEKLVKASIKALRPHGLRVRKRGPEFAGRHLKGGQAVGHILGVGSLDFEGHLQGRWLAFDAKATTNTTSFPLSGIRSHQAEMIEDAATQGAMAFLLVEFTDLEPAPRYFALDWSALEPWWVPYRAGAKGARASIPLGAFAHDPKRVGEFDVRAVEVKRAGKLLDLLAAVHALATRAGGAA